MVLATVPAAPPTRKNLRATSWPAPISANVPYLAGSKLMWRAFSSVPISICGFIHFSKIVFPSRQTHRCKDATLFRKLSGVARHPYHSGLLQPHLLGLIRRNPTAQVIRQRGVGPITAGAQNLNFTSRRQRENAVGGVRCSEARLHILACDDRERTPPVSPF